MKFVNFLPVTDETCYLVHHLEFHSNGNHQVTDDDLADIIPDCPNLETTLFSGVPDLSDRTLVLLAHSAHDLRCIDISGCVQATNVGVLELASHANRLEVVRLNDITILTDPSVSALARSLPHLKELGLCRLPLLTASSVRDIWTHARQIRKLRLSKCPQLTDKAFPSAITPVTTPTHSSGTWSFWRRPRNGMFPSGPREVETIIPRTTDTDQLGLPAVRPRPLTWLDELPPLVLSSSQRLDCLRVLDLGHCWRITDEAIIGIVRHAPKIQCLYLSGCFHLTDLALEHIAMLGDHLNVLSIGHLDRVTDRGIVKLTRGCSKLRSIDTAYCTSLTDLSVLELASLPNLRRLSVVHLRSLTDNALLFLAEHTPALSRLSISQCPRFSLEAISTLVNKLIGLELLSASGLPALRRRGVKRFSDRTPAGYNKALQGPFRVFRGNKIDELRRFLCKEEHRRREAENKNFLFTPRGDDSLALY